MNRFVVERKYWVLMLLLWTAVVATSFLWYWRELDKHAREMALSQGRFVFTMVQSIRLWNARHGGVYAPVTNFSPPNPYLDVPNRDLPFPGGGELTLINPAYMTRQLSDVVRELSAVRVHITSLKPINPDNRADPWERAALRSFEQGNKETFNLTERDGGGEFRYMAPLVTKHACLTCHAKQGYHAGDIRGGISVSFTAAPLLAAQYQGTRSVAITHTAVWVLLSGIGWLALSRQRRSLLALQEANGQLARERDEQQQLNCRLQDAQAQLYQSEKMASIGQLAAGVAHEINNPVGFVSSNLRTLERYTDDLMRLLDGYLDVEGELSEQRRAALNGLREQADLEFLRDDMPQLIRESQSGALRVQRIVQDLKDFSHVDDAAWQWADLHQGMDSTLNIVHNELKYKAEVVKIYGDLPRVRCLPGQLNQVFMNLLINAAQAIPAHGTITITTGYEPEQEQVWVEVADSGSGIPGERLQRIFEPFFTTKPVGQGTGLGLSLAYGIVQKHRGRIDVHSTPGVGTRFRVSLPVDAKPA